MPNVQDRVPRAARSGAYTAASAHSRRASTRRRRAALALPNVQARQSDVRSMRWLRTMDIEAGPQRPCQILIRALVLAGGWVGDSACAARIARPFDSMPAP